MTGAGIGVGATTAKAVVMGDYGTLGRYVVPTGHSEEAAAEKVERGNLEDSRRAVILRERSDPKNLGLPSLPVIAPGRIGIVKDGWWWPLPSHGDSRRFLARACALRMTKGLKITD